MAEATSFFKTLPKLSLLLVFLPATLGLQFAGNEGLALFWRRPWGFWAR